jgi:O-antigen/teichoic acid export membrane protein
MLAAGLSAATALAMAAAGHGVWALVGSAMMMHAVKAVAYNTVRPLAVVPRLSSAAITRLARFGVLATTSSLLYFVFGQIDVVIGGRVLGKDAIGLYAVALSLATIPMQKILPVLNQVSFAAFSRIQSDRERVRRNLLRGAQLVGLVCFPVFLGMGAVAPDMVPVVLGDRWSQLIVPFQLLCLVLPFKAIAALYSPALFGVGRPGVNVGNMVVAVGAMSAAILVGVQHGLVGLCLAWVIAYPGVFAVMTWRSLRTLEASAGQFLGRSAFPAVAGVLMALGVMGLREMLGPHGASALRLCALVAWGVLLYGGLVLLFQRNTVRELLAVARS